MRIIYVVRYLSRTLKNLVCPQPEFEPMTLGKRRTLYHVAIKAGLYRNAVQVYGSPNLYRVTKNKLLFTWLSLVVSMVMSFCAVLFPTRCLG